MRNRIFYSNNSTTDMRALASPSERTTRALAAGVRQKRRLRRAVAAIGLLLAMGTLAISSQPAAAGAPAMTVLGQFGVGATGAANYSIPITVPPGTAGMVPSLSLGYSSQGSDGIVGLGWMLSGLLSIDRCPRTFAEDGAHGGVEYDSNDRFCLNGQRLVATSGTYGANATEYHTELDTFVKVVSYGTSGSGPQYFKVWTKSGQIMELGNTTDSRILAVGTSTARTWALNKITDVKGNYFTVTYTNDTTNGQYYPTRIDYTGNASAGLATYNSVQFAYTTRSDIVPTYTAGALQQTTVLLTHVKTYQGSNLVLDYQLGYRLGSSTTHSRLTSVTLCDSGGSNCLAPTTFGWQGGTGTLTATSTSTPSLVGAKFGDFNGDGLTDALLPTVSAACSGSSIQATLTVMTGSNSGTWTQTQPTATYGSCSWVPLTASIGGVLDFNGDGLMDAFLVQQVSHFTYNPYFGTWMPGYYAYALKNVSPTSFVQTSVVGAGAGSNIPNLVVNGNTGIPSPTYVTEDFNGDGLEEMPGSVSNGDGTFSSNSTYSLPSGSTQAFPADFDGHGCTGYLTQGSGANKISYFCNSALSGVNTSSWTGQIVPGDFNGDGMMDVLIVPTSGNGTLFLSSGAGLIASSFTVPSGWDSGYKIVAGDFNGDGKDDIALVKQSGGGTHDVYVSTGNGFAFAVSLTNAGYGTSPVSADLNSDGAMDLLIDSTSFTFGYTPELMISASNGIGATTTITYDRINKNGTLYTKGSGATYPTKDLDGAIYVASRIDASNGIGGTYSSTYAYTAAKTDLKGRGFLGLSSVKSTDSQTGIIATTNYRTDFPYAGLVSSQTTVSGSVTLSSATNTYADTNEGTGTDGVVRHFLSLTQSVVAANDLDGTAFPTATTNYTYDSYGNALTANVSVSDGSSKNTTNTFSNNTTSWFLGQLTSTQVHSTVGSSSITRTSCFQYDSTYGLLTREVIEPVSTSNCTYSSTGVQTDYTYDAFGHRITATISGSGITTRSTSAGYDLLGEFQTSSTNALSQSESWTYTSAQSLAFGEPTSHTGPNGLTTSWTYDSFGRPTLETRPDGNKTATSYAYCSGVNGGSASCVTYGAFIATATPQNSSGTQNGAQAIAYYDSLSRGIAGDAQGFDGTWIRQATNYDSWGRVSQTSRPYFVSGGTAKWTVYTDDILGRPTHVALPNGGYANYAYHGLTTSVTNDHSQTTTTVKNAQGLTASVTDALSHATSYVYDAFGNLLTVTDPSSNVITNTYDVRGNKTASTDPDMGHWTYVYDVLGELTSQTDAKSQTTTLAYDVLGRVASRTETGLYSAWTYGTTAASHNVGKPIEAKACTTSGCSSVVSDKTFTYDGYGRPYTNTLATGGTNYTYTEGYDANGRPSTVAYPSGFTATYAYTSLGYLSQIKNGATALWTANTRDAELHLLTQTFGNGVAQTNTFDANTGFLTNVRAGPSNAVAQFDYTYDTLGNLNYRSDNLNGVFEFSCYDALNRLTQYAAGNGASACTSSQNHKVVAYDALGDITSKTGVGTYTYGAGAAGPHAVTSIAGTVNGVVNPTYTYDNNGNMTAGAGRSVTYTAFNMADAITQGTTSANLDYDEAHQRIRQTLTQGSTVTTTTYLNDPASGAMSEKAVTGSTTTWHDYLQADGHFVAERFCTGAAPCSSGASWNYFVADHLGSIAVAMNAAGAVVERDYYDAWGKRRNADGSDNTACSLTSLTTRGFTGQEQIDAECLINANARIYDQTIARFMTADTIIPDSFDGQAFNRYSYVSNNPLSATDPSGHDSFKPCQNPSAPCDWKDELTKWLEEQMREIQNQATDALASCISLGMGGQCKAAGNALDGTNNAGLQNANWSSSDGLGDGTVRGRNGSVLTREQIGNVVFNELRSLSGPGLDNAELYVAHAIINGLGDYGANRPATASTIANPSSTEGNFYYNAQMSAALAIEQASMGIDPTGGADWFNLRNTNSTSDFQGHSISTQSGPFDNSYTRGGLNSTGVYVNTYGGGGGT